MSCVHYGLLLAMLGVVLCIAPKTSAATAAGSGSCHQQRQGVSATPIVQPNGTWDIANQRRSQAGGV